MKKNITPGHKPSPIISGRTRFAGDLVAEFWMPRKPSRKAIILCDGCPSLPSRHKVGEFFAKKGYWVFHPRYRGSWESDGVFLKESPDADVIAVATALNEGFFDMVSGETYFLDVSEIVVIGASFGGAAAILSLNNPIISKAIALSPVIDWRAPSKAEPFSYLVFLLKEGFGGAYRVDKNAWKKLKGGKFYAPHYGATHIDVRKLFIAHAIDDEIVPVAPLRLFAKHLKFKPFLLKQGGHFSVKKVMEQEIWKPVPAFSNRKHSNFAQSLIFSLGVFCEILMS